jgi:hypothetical protein
VCASFLRTSPRDRRGAAAEATRAATPGRQDASIRESSTTAPGRWFDRAPRERLSV